MMVEEASTAAPGRGSKVKTVAAGFRASPAQLLDKLRAAEPNFIRCVKPNAEKVPDKLAANLVREQLVLGGGMEAVRIWQRGYASRNPFEEFGTISEADGCSAPSPFCTWHFSHSR